MRKLTSKEIKAGAAEFAARLKERAEAMALDPPPRDGRVFYKVLTVEPRLVEARVLDGKDRAWTATGPTCRRAFIALLSQLEKVAGAGDETVRVLLGVIESAPNRRPPRRGPAQGGLL